ncbi:MAG: VIT domain-containing protein [bacterium]|nr:VIT domain-containing protein [bacterium]
MKRFSLVFAVAATFAGWGQDRVPVDEPIIQPIPPIIRPVNLRADEKPMTVDAWTVDARVSGAFATVSTEFAVGNPNGRVLEGSLEFPLPDGASVCGYALDIDGVMTDGVVVPKEKARVAFEAEVKRGVDPGLVEHLKGNAYRTRIYPIPAHGARRVRLVYVAPLASAPNGDVALVLTMPRTKLKERKVSISVPMGGGMPKPVLGGLGDNRFAEAEAVWRTETRETDVTPEADVTVALPALPERLVSVETRGAECWFAVNEKAPDLNLARTSLPLTWRILWDCSGSRDGQAAAAALAVVEKLPENACYELILFSCRAEKPVICATRGELLTHLRRCGYDGGTDFGALAKALREGPPCENRTLLFTDGMDVLSDGDVDFGANKPIALVSGAMKDCASLRRLCAGRVIDLSVRTPEQALAEIADSPATLVGAEGKGIANIQGIGQLARGRVTVLGRLEGESAEIRLNYGYGRRSAPIQIRRADAREGKTLATAWAASRVEELSARADDHAEELLALGRRYGLTSPVTSLIVFERLDQWLEYDIEPPMTAQKLHDEWTRQRPSESQRTEREESRAKDYFSRLKKEWNERVQWWENPIPPKPKTPKSGLFERAFGNGATPRGALRRPSRAVEVAEEDAVAADVAEPMSAPARVEAAAPAASRSDLGDAKRSVAASVKVQAWSPDTPYLRALKDAKAALGANGEFLYAEYLAQRKIYSSSPAFYLDCAGFFFSLKENAIAVRIISNLAELRLEDPGLLRTCAWRLKEAGEFDAALPVLRKVAKLRAEQPFSFRDLAIVLEERGRKNLDAADIEEAMKYYHKTAFTAWTVDSGIWTAVVAIEELNALIAWSERQDWKDGRKPNVPDIEKEYRRNLDTDLRIAMEWDVDNTDVDLHVLEPDGEEAFYSHRRTLSGGYVSHDVTTGYGPEEYLKKTGAAGEYKILVNYFGSRQQTLLGPATVTATVFTNWGRPNETRQTLSLRLEKVKDKVPLGTIDVKP